MLTQNFFNSLATPPGRGAIGVIKISGDKMDLSQTLKPKKELMRC